MEVDAKKLVHLVRERSAIYDTRHKDHQNKEETERLWAEIANEMPLPVADCKAKWVGLRNSYVRQLRIDRLSRKRRKRWYLTDSMSFLKSFVHFHGTKRTNKVIPTNERTKRMPITVKLPPEALCFKSEDSIVHMTRAKTVPTMPGLDCSDAHMQDFRQRFLSESESEEIAEVGMNDATSTISTATECTMSVPKPFRVAPPETSIAQPVPANSVSTVATGDSGNALFFRSIMADFEKLSSKRQRKFRVHMMQLMNDMQEEDENAALYGTAAESWTTMDIL